MQHIDYHDRDYLAHAAEVMGDRIGSQDGYTHLDERAQNKLTAIGQGGTALVLTGEELNRDQAAELLDQVILAELNHWVPGASQRLLKRAAAALGFVYPVELLHDTGNDCGPQRILHSLTIAWLGKRSYMCCSTCGRLFD